MILDASAIAGILLEEPDRNELLAKIAGAERAAVGAPTLVETAMVLEGRLGPGGSDELADFVARMRLEVVPFQADHYRIAVDAFHRFGRGRHPASLNFGDCLAYAVAKVADEPLLCKGGDFAKTDVALA